MNKKAFTILFFCFIGLSAYGQDSYVKGRWNIKIGYSRYKLAMVMNGEEKTTGHYRLETNYGISNYLETGIYIGLSSIQYNLHIDSSTSILSEYIAPFYGATINFHLLPFFIKKDDFRFDTYLSGKLGGALIKDSDGRSIHKSEYSVGLGLAFYPWKHIGVFSEFNVGEFVNEHYATNDYFKIRYGITLKF